jgi:Baseplate J-like protein
VKPVPNIEFDARDAERLFTELQARGSGYLPDWRPTSDGPDAGFVRGLARYLEILLERIRQAPLRNRLAFLDLLGVRPIPAQSARAPIVIRLIDQTNDARLPAGTRLSAPPPPGKTDQVIFETESSTGLTGAKLKEVVSLWPGRDQYIDHSADFLAGSSFQPFLRQKLDDTPHHLYLAHDTLLALSGKCKLVVEFELSTPGSEFLELIWEYWDGALWRGFSESRPACGEEALAWDGTNGLQQSGPYMLTTDCAESDAKDVNGITARWVRARLREPLLPTAQTTLPEVESIRLSTVITRPLSDLLPDQIAPDQAFSDGTKLDLSQSFYPLGTSPQPGNAFYFSSGEIFGKPHATLEVEIVAVSTPQDALNASSEKPPDHTGLAVGEPDTPVPAPADLLHTLLGGDATKYAAIWEYWNGKRWDALPPASEQPLPVDQDSVPGGRSGVFRFDIPDDFVPLKVNDVDGLWMRLRLVWGGIYETGRTSWIDSLNRSNTFTFPIPRVPAFSRFRMGYTWQHGPYYAEHVLAFNDFRYEDSTDAARWPGIVFQPFVPVGDITPALYLGLSKRLPVDWINFFFDIEEDPADLSGPVLAWEYWDGFSWRVLQVQDRTQNLRVPGMVSFIAAPDSRPLARFSIQLHWIRARLKEDGPPGAPVIDGIYPISVWASQRQTFTDEPLGTSNGRPNQTFAFRQIPVLEGQLIEVMEISGPRADVEWRMAARELFADDPLRYQQLESLLRTSPGDVELPPLRLKRDRNRRISQVWVQWQEAPHFFDSGPKDRHFVLDHAAGKLRVGDGVHAAVPSAGAALSARMYQSGGGVAGNVPARAITQLQSAIAGLDSVFNVKPAEGGAERESLESFSQRAPLSLRTRERALLPEDYEVLAREASPVVAVARAVPLRNPQGDRQPGWITLQILPDSSEPKPWPTFGLREQVRTFLEDRAYAGLAAANHVYVTGPEYQPVSIDISIHPLDMSESGAVEQRVRQAVQSFLHPLRGGPGGGGWDLGRDVYASDAAAVVERVDGVDYVRQLTLLRDGEPQGEHLAVPEDRIVMAGEIRIRVE